MGLLKGAAEVLSRMPHEKVTSGVRKLCQLQTSALVQVREGRRERRREERRRRRGREESGREGRKKRGKEEAFEQHEVCYLPPLF